MPRIYRHLSLAEQDRIMRLRNTRVPVSNIAIEFGRHPATTYQHVYGSEALTLRLNSTPKKCYPLNRNSYFEWNSQAGAKYRRFGLHQICRVGFRHV